MRKDNAMRSIAALSLVAVALALGACATPDHASGFLGDYSKLKKSSRDPELRAWFDPKVDFLEYDRLLIDPVEVVLAPGAAAAALDPATMQSLAEDLRATVVRVVDPYYTVLDQPASRTIRVHAALTDVKMRPGGVTSADLEGARCEWELFDALTKQRIGAGMRWRDVPEGTVGFESWANGLLSFMNARQEMTR